MYHRCSCWIGFHSAVVRWHRTVKLSGIICLVGSAPSLLCRKLLALGTLGKLYTRPEPSIKEKHKAKLAVPPDRE